MLFNSLFLVLTRAFRICAVGIFILTATYGAYAFELEFKDESIFELNGFIPAKIFKLGDSNSDFSWILTGFPRNAPDKRQSFQLLLPSSGGIPSVSPVSENLELNKSGAKVSGNSLATEVKSKLNGNISNGVLNGATQLALLSSQMGINSENVIPGNILGACVSNKTLFSTRLLDGNYQILEITNSGSQVRFTEKVSSVYPDGPAIIADCADSKRLLAWQSGDLKGMGKVAQDAVQLRFLDSNWNILKSLSLPASVFDLVRSKDAICLARIIREEKSSKLIVSNINSNFENIQVAKELELPRSSQSAIVLVADNGTPIALTSAKGFLFYQVPDDGKCVEGVSTGGSAVVQLLSGTCIRNNLFLVCAAIGANGNPVLAVKRYVLHY
jgi:hypothetical protein